MARCSLLFVALAVACAWPAAAGAAVCDVSPQGVSFGSYDPLSSSPLNGVGNISVDCDEPVSFTITLGTGAGSYSARKMSAGAGELEYNLYTDATRLLVWGDGSGSSGTVSTTAETVNIPVYGRVPARQNVPAAGYGDVIVVTVTY